MELLKVVLTSLLSAAALFVIAKIMGHKQMSQLDFFDYITGITIGSIAAELATELEEPLKPLIAMIVYGIIAVSLSVLTSKLPKMRKFINGTPTIVMNNGKLYRKNMKKAKLDLSEFLVLCRQEGYFNLSEIQTAIFEYNGRLTVLPVSNKRPINPEDMNLSPQPAHIFTEVIMDGRILEDNLKRMGLDYKWLQTQLKSQGFRSAKEVFLGLCDENKQLSLYKAE
ncbi:MAG: YetF domain-containing protein [Acutalibacteraceae bacterium]